MFYFLLVIVFALGSRTFDFQLLFWAVWRNRKHSAVYAVANSSRLSRPNMSLTTVQLSGETLLNITKRNQPWKYSVILLNKKWDRNLHSIHFQEFGVT